MKHTDVRSESMWMLICRIVSLLDKNGGQSLPHNSQGIGQYLRLIIDHRVVIGWVVLVVIVQVLLLMAIYQYMYIVGLGYVDRGCVVCAEGPVHSRTNH